MTFLCKANMFKDSPPNSVQALPTGDVWKFTGELKQNEAEHLLNTEAQIWQAFRPFNHRDPDYAQKISSTTSLMLTRLHPALTTTTDQKTIILQHIIIKINGMNIYTYNHNNK